MLELCFEKCLEIFWATLSWQRDEECVGTERDIRKLYQKICFKKVLAKHLVGCLSQKHAVENINKKSCKIWCQFDQEYGETKRDICIKKYAWKILVKYVVRFSSPKCVQWNIWKKCVAKSQWQCGEECGETGGDIWKLYQIFLYFCKISVRYLSRSYVLEIYPEKMFEKISCKTVVAVWGRVWWDGWRYLEVASDISMFL